MNANGVFEQASGSGDWQRWLEGHDGQMSV